MRFIVFPFRLKNVDLHITAVAIVKCALIHMRTVHTASLNLDARVKERIAEAFRLPHSGAN